MRSSCAFGGTSSDASRCPRRQRERDLLDLGWREPDAGWPDGQGDAPLLPLVGYRDLGGEG